MSVKYEENEHGIFWVEDGVEGEPQKDLHHAMRDYELTASGRKEIKQREGERVHTGDDGGPGEGSGGLVADNGGSAGEEEADTNSGEGGTGGPEGVGAQGSAGSDEG